MSSANFIKNIISKDNHIATQAIKNLINTANIEDFIELCNKSDFIFPFVQEKIINNFIKLVEEKDIETIFKFSTIYSENFENIIIKSWLKFACEDLTDKILNLFENGTLEQKIYCAKYFTHIQDPLAIEYLKKEAYNNDLNLKSACAKALKAFQDTEISDKMKNIILNSNDAFENLCAYEYLISYNSQDTLSFCLEKCFNSPFILNIICLILENNNFNSLTKILNEEKINFIYQILLENYPENLSLETIEYYQIFDFIQYIKKEDNNYSKLLLYYSYQQFYEYSTQDIYTFDLNKNIKTELENITQFLKNIQLDIDAIKETLKKYKEEKKFELALNIIQENNLKECSEIILELINQNQLSQNLFIKAIETIKVLNETSKINKKIIENLQDENAKALCLSLI